MTPRSPGIAVHGAVCAALLALWPARAAQAAIPVGLSDGPRGVGVGVILGEPTGLSGAWRGQGASTCDIALAWSVPGSSLHLHSDYLYELLSFRDPASPVVDFPVYIGAGARVRIGEGFHNGHANLLGLRFPVGMGVRGGEVPVEGFLELAPVLVLYSDLRLTADAALGVRVFFARREEPPPQDTP